MPKTEVERRWENGDDHDPRSEALFEALAVIDARNSDYFIWKSGGDGDNGEELMYHLDIYFTERDAQEASNAE
jgi:hypothetical protein